MKTDPMKTGPIKTGTKMRTLTAARGLLQSFGYNGFSFQHVADIVGVKKPSLYEHFNSKEALGSALIADYHQRFEDWIKVTSIFSPQEQLVAFFEIFYNFSKDKKKCCVLTVLSAELNTLPTGLCAQLRKMRNLQETWLEQVINAGKKSKQFKSKLPSSDLAELLMTLCYGSQLSARIANNPQLILQTRNQALEILGVKVSKVFQI